ncbi:MAG: hypothetical protein V3V44_05360, partial [Anaerolineales bacterium]
QDVTLIFGASEDKDIPGMLVELMPRVSKVIVTQANHPRAASLDNLAQQARAYGSPVETISPVSSALEHAANHVDEDEVILAAGSLFVAGEVITAWQNIRQDLKNKNKVGD